MLSSTFVNASPLPRAPQRSHRQPVICSHGTLILVPDHFSEKTPRWYRKLQAQLPEIHVDLLQMPNPYESNTKRWESVWLGVIRESTQSTEGEVGLLGHGTGADACMRFLENNSVNSGVVLIAPTGDEYFAGERHGRPYHWDNIRANVGAGLVLATSASLDRAEKHTLVKGLQPNLVHELSTDFGRYTEREEAHEVAQFVRFACVLDVS